MRVKTSGFEAFYQQNGAVLDERLQQAQKMQAVGIIACGLAHDFNNSLAVIMGYAELLKPVVPEEDTEKLERIRLASTRASQIVKQLLSIGHKPDAKPEPMLLAPVVKEAIKLISASYMRTHEFVLRKCDETLTSPISQVRLHQTIFNLCINAAESYPEGGKIYVSLESARVTRPGIGGRKVAFAALCVQDKGCGIAPEDNKLIFEPFYTTKHTGTGLGLSMVKKFAEEAGGWVELHSKLGEGSSFWVFLPLVEPAPEHAGLDEEMAGELKKSHSGARIAIYDSNPELTEIYQRIFSAHGLKPDCFHAEDDFRSYCASKGSEVDVFIADDFAPGCGLRTLIGAMRQAKPNASIILTCSAGIAEDVAFSAGSGEVFACLPKPIVYPNLVGTVENALHQCGR